MWESLGSERGWSNPATARGAEVEQQLHSLSINHPDSKGKKKYTPNVQISKRSSGHTIPLDRHVSTFGSSPLYRPNVAPIHAPLSIPLRRDMEDGSDESSGTDDTHDDDQPDTDSDEDELLRRSNSRATLELANSGKISPTAQRRRLRAAMANTTMALRNDLAAKTAAAIAAARGGSGIGMSGLNSGSESSRQRAEKAVLIQQKMQNAQDVADQLLPPPLPLIQSRQKEFVSRLPKTGFGVDAVPACRTPFHSFAYPGPEPLSTQLNADTRAILMAKLKQYDAERNDPNVPLSPLFINRLIFDCTASPIFSKRWVTGKIPMPDGSIAKCTCMNCSMYGNPSSSPPPLSSSSPFSGASLSPSMGPSSGPPATDPAECNGSWQVDVRSYYTPTSAADTTLVFESRFESGNLRTAFQVSEHEYDLTIRPDFNTTHHTQWYYFSVRNTRKNRVYKFNLINFVKPNSLYNEGLQPLVYSTINNSSASRNSKQQVSSSQPHVHPQPPNPNAAGGPASDKEKERMEQDALDNPFSYESDMSGNNPFSTGAAASDFKPAAASNASASSSGASATATAQRIGWFRAGSNVCYYQNHIQRGSSRQKYYYTLSFTIEFEHDNDTVYFAYAYPYTYTQLNRDLYYLESNPLRNKYVKRRMLCRSLAGNEVDMLTITDYSATAEELKHRKGIVYTARVHPGESNSSWMMRGCMEFLTSAHPIAVQLRRIFIFKLVPMLNVDGVVNGNYRCSLAGVDLNRNWKTPSSTIHPTIYSTKMMIKRFALVRPILMCVDLHGHSRKFNIFLYGCPNPNLPSSNTIVSNSNFFDSTNGHLAGQQYSATGALFFKEPPNAPSATGTEKEKKKLRNEKEREQKEMVNNPHRLLERVYPKLLSREPTSGVNNTTPWSSQPPLIHRPPSGNLPATGFHMGYCTFSISRGKESTARVVLWREIGLMNSFTLEASFAGATVGALKGLHFHSTHFENMGRSMVATLWDYLNPELHEATRLALCEQYPIEKEKSGAPAEDDSDDSSDSPDELALPLTVGRTEAAVKRKAKKKSLSQRRAEKLARLTQSTASTANAASPDVESQKPVAATAAGTGKRVSFSANMVSASPKSSDQRRSVAVAEKEEAAVIEAARKLALKKKRAAERAAATGAAVRKRQEEEAMFATSAGNSDSDTGGNSNMSGSNAPFNNGYMIVQPNALAPNLMGISSYYRPTVTPTLARPHQGSAMTVAMIINEEDERARIAQEKQQQQASMDSSPTGSGDESASPSPLHHHHQHQYESAQLQLQHQQQPQAQLTRRGSLQLSSSIASGRTRPKSAYPLATASSLVGQSPGSLLIDSTRQHYKAPSSTHRPGSAVVSSGYGQQQATNRSRPVAHTTAARSPGVSPSPVRSTESNHTSASHLTAGSTMFAAAPALSPTSPAALAYFYSSQESESTTVPSASPSPSLGLASTPSGGDSDSGLRQESPSPPPPALLAHSSSELIRQAHLSAQAQAQIQRLENLERQKRESARIDRIISLTSSFHEARTGAAHALAAASAATTAAASINSTAAAAAPGNITNTTIAPTTSPPSQTKYIPSTDNGLPASRVLGGHRRSNSGNASATVSSITTTYKNSSSSNASGSAGNSNTSSTGNWMRATANPAGSLLSPSFQAPGGASQVNSRSLLHSSLSGTNNSVVSGANGMNLLISGSSAVSNHSMFGGMANPITPSVASNRPPAAARSSLVATAPGRASPPPSNATTAASLSATAALLQGSSGLSSVNLNRTRSLLSSRPPSAISNPPSLKSMPSNFSGINASSSVLGSSVIRPKSAINRQTK